MRFAYPARLRRTASDEIVVSFRDLPECLTSGTDEAEAFSEAADALEEAIAGRIDDRESIPDPSPRRARRNRGQGGAFPRLAEQRRHPCRPCRPARCRRGERAPVA